MIEINYDRLNFLYPFDYALQHFQAAPKEVVWKGRVVHLIVGTLEFLFPINYIIALFDRVIGIERQRLIQQRIEENQRQELQQAINNLTNGLEFGFTSNRDPITVLALRGIESAQDLRALDLYWLDDALPSIRSSLTQLEGLLTNKPHIEDSSLKQIFENLKNLRERSNRKKQDVGYNPLDIRKLRTELIDIKDGLEEHVDAYLPDWIKPLFTERFKALDDEFGKGKENWSKEHQELESILTDIVTIIQVTPHCDSLKQHVLEVSAFINRLLDIEIRFSKETYQDLEVVQFETIGDIHRKVQKNLTDLSEGLKEWTIQSLPDQLNQFKAILSSLESYNQLSQVAQLRLYINQVNSTTAWKALNKAGIPNLTAYRESYPEVQTPALYDLGLTWA